MKKLDIKIQISLNELNALEEVLNKINELLKKECNCTCTLEVAIQ